MTDMQNKEAENSIETRAAPSRKVNLLLFSIIGGILLSLGTGAGVYLLMKTKPTGSSLSKQISETEVEKSVYFEIANVVVNLRQTHQNKKSIYFKLSVSLEIDSKKEYEILSVLQPRIIDQFQVYLRELTLEDLSAAEGGAQRLREELLSRVNAVTAPLKVKNLLFKDLLIQ